MTDETPIPDESVESSQNDGDGEIQPKPEIDVSLLPSLPTHPRSQSMPGTNIGRWATFGCVVVMLMLVVLLVFGVHVTKRTVWVAYARAQQRLVENLPNELSSGDRMRTERNLQRFRARLDMGADPMPLIGQFLNEVTGVFEDDRLTMEEIGDLNQWLEDTLDTAGIETP